MELSEQYCIAASNGNQILALIYRNISYKETEVIKPLFKAKIKLYIEYLITVYVIVDLLNESFRIMTDMFRHFTK